jgi:hypothetical protein
MSYFFFSFFPGKDQTGVVFKVDWEYIGNAALLAVEMSNELKQF